MVVHTCNGIFNHFLASMGTEKNAYRWVIPFVHLVLFIIGDVGIELSKVFMLELVVFQFNDDTAMQNSVVEDKVGKIVFVIDNHTFLLVLKAEAFAKFKQEFMQMVYQCILQVTFCYYVFGVQPQELERKWLTNSEGRSICFRFKSAQQFLGVFAYSATEIEIS